MLERAALHQTRFRTPGVSPDARGVVLGHKGLVLFPSIDRLVSFLRAYGDEASIDELLPSLEIRRVITPLRTREIVLSINAETSYRMDVIAGVAKLAGGLVFTGTQRHFVKYRDAAAPLGYDVQELLDQPADLVLYHDTFRQTYSFEREIPFGDLVLRLTPYRLPPAERPLPSRTFATAETGIGAALVGYLFRWQVPARAAIAEWPPQSAFQDDARRLYLFELGETPPRVLALMTSMPGVRVYEPLGAAFAVELGFRHPIALESCASLFPEGSLHLFGGDGVVIRVDELPPFAPVRTLVRAELRGEETAVAPRGRGVDASMGMSLSLRLAPSQEPWRNVVASIVPIAEREWLARLLYALPPATLAALRIATSDECIFLLDPAGIEGVPLGTFYSEVAPRIYVPAGQTLVPAVSPDVLAELVRDRGDGHVFFEPGADVPRVVPAEAFGPVSRRVLRSVAAVPVRADPFAEPDTPLPLLQYDKPRRFPLWGVPAADAAEAPPPDGENEP